MALNTRFKQQIISKGRAKFWFVDDFVTIGSNDSVRKALQQLTNEQILLRICHGVYYYPKIDRELGLGVLMPSKESTALAIAATRCLLNTTLRSALGAPIAVSGAFAVWSSRRSCMGYVCSLCLSAVRTTRRLRYTYRTHSLGDSHRGIAYRPVWFGGLM